MGDKPPTGGQADGGSNAKTPSVRYRRGLWRRFVRLQMRKLRKRQAERERRYAAEKPEDRAARKTANATIWIAVFTVVLALASILTLVEVIIGGGDTHALAVAAGTQAARLSNVSDAADKIRRAAQEMVAQDQRIADTSKDAIDASDAQGKSALDAAIQQSHLDQRAWVVIRGIAGKPELDKPWNPQVIFDNTGKTPARNVRTSCNLSPGDGDMPPTIVGVSFGNPNFLAPGDEVFCTLKGSSKIGQTDLDVLNSGRTEIFIYGSAVYKDVFGSDHWVTFCRIMSPDGSGWNPCKAYNDTGDGEKPPPN